MDKTFARKLIKAQAWGNLRGNWLRAFLAMIIESFLAMLILSLLPIRRPLIGEVMKAAGDTEQLIRLFIPNEITERMVALVIVTIILYLIVLSPFSIGFCRYYLKAGKGEKGNLSDVFSVYTSLKTVFSSVWLSLLIFFISSFWTVIFMLIPIALMICAVFLEIEILYYLSILLVPVACLFTAFWNSRYRLARYIFAEGRLGAFASLRECSSLLYGRGGEILMLRVSYVLWDMISVYIPVLSFVYAALSGTVYAKYLSYLRGEPIVTENNIPPIS